MPASASPESVCPSCGKFVGPIDTCPYCTASLSQRLSLRVFKYGSLVVAVLGTFLLWIAARHMDIPVVKVGEILPTMNFAYVRIVGDVTNLKTYDPQKKFLSFRVSDGTGDLAVFAFRQTAEQLVREKKVPQTGDRVDLAGKLSVRDNFTSLILDSPRRVIVRAIPAEEVPVRRLTRNLLGRKIKTGGVVEAVDAFANLEVLTLRDPQTATATVQVPFSAAWGVDADIRPQDRVTVVGMLTQYKGQLQIAPLGKDFIGVAGPHTEIEVIQEKTQPPRKKPVEPRSLGTARSGGRQRLEPTEEGDDLEIIFDPRTDPSRASAPEDGLETAPMEKNAPDIQIFQEETGTSQRKKK